MYMIINYNCKLITVQFLGITDDIYLLTVYHARVLSLTATSNNISLHYLYKILAPRTRYITYPVRYSVYFAGFNETALAFIWSGTSGPVISIIVHHSRAAQFLHCPWGAFVTNETRNNQGRFVNFSL